MPRISILHISNNTQNIFKSIRLKYRYELKKNSYIFEKINESIIVIRMSSRLIHHIHRTRTKEKEQNARTHQDSHTNRKWKGMENGREGNQITCVIFQSVSWTGTTTTESACTSVLEELTAFLTSQRQCAPAAITPA